MLFKKKDTKPDESVDTNAQTVEETQEDASLVDDEPVEVKHVGRRMYGSDTASGIAYREQLKEERRIEAEQNLLRNKIGTIIGSSLCVITLVAGVTGIVHKAGEMNRLKQTIVAKTAELQEIKANPRHERVEKQADVANASEFVSYVCDCQNTLTNYVFNESLNEVPMTPEHIDFLDKYKKYASDVRINSSALSTTWLSDAVDVKSVKRMGRTSCPFTWVGDSDIDILGVESDAVFKCYMDYGTPQEQLVFVVTCRYNNKENIASRFSSYQSDTYAELKRNDNY